MFKTWMNTSNVGRTTSRPFCDWDVEAIVEVGGGCEESARRDVRKIPNLCLIRCHDRSTAANPDDSQLILPPCLVKFTQLTEWASVGQLITDVKILESSTRSR